jgi:hypothetical protein
MLMKPNYTKAKSPNDSMVEGSLHIVQQGRLQLHLGLKPKGL